MKATVKTHPKIFRSLKKKIFRQIKAHRITIVKKRFQSNVGRAYFDQINFIKIPVIRDLESIYIILHEIGHVANGHTKYAKKHSFIEEMEAELYALRYLKLWKMHKMFPDSYKAIKDRAEYYVRCEIMVGGIEKGLKISNINLKALKFCKIASFIKNHQGIRQLSSKKRKK